MFAKKYCTALATSRKEYSGVAIPLPQSSYCRTIPTSTVHEQFAAESTGQMGECQGMEPEGHCPCDEAPGLFY